MLVTFATEASSKICNKLENSSSKHYGMSTMTSVHVTVSAKGRALSRLHVPLVRLTLKMSREMSRRQLTKGSKG